MEENGTLPGWSWPLAMALIILDLLALGLTLFVPLTSYWLAAMPLYFFCLGLTSLVLFSRPERTEADVFQWLVRATLPPALVGFIGLALIPGAKGLADLIQLGINILMLVWVVTAIVELVLHLAGVVRGTGQLSGGSLSEVIIALLGKLLIPAKLDKIKLKAGEKILMVTYETKWKNVYKKTVLAFFHALLPAFGLSIVVDAGLVFYLFVTSFQQIVDGTFGVPVPLLIVIGLVGFALVEVPVTVYRYHMEELGRRLLKIIVTNQQVLVWATNVPFGYCVSSATPLTEVKDVTSGPVGFKAAEVEKKESPVSLFDQWWAGWAYRKIQARTVNLPSQLREASDLIVLENAVAGFMDVLRALVAEAKVYDLKLKDGKDMLARSEIMQRLSDLGVAVESHTTVADPVELAAALLLILNPEGLPERSVDALTLEDPGICNLIDGTVDLNAIRGGKPRTAGTAAAPGIGFKRVPRPGATV